MCTIILIKLFTLSSSMIFIVNLFEYYKISLCNNSFILANLLLNNILYHKRFIFPLMIIIHNPYKTPIKTYLYDSFTLT